MGNQLPLCLILSCFPGHETLMWKTRTVPGQIILFFPYSHFLTILDASPVFMGWKSKLFIQDTRLFRIWTLFSFSFYFFFSLLAGAYFRQNTIANIIHDFINESGEFILIIKVEFIYIRIYLALKTHSFVDGEFPWHLVTISNKTLYCFIYLKNYFPCYIVKLKTQGSCYSLL